MSTSWLIRLSAPASGRFATENELFETLMKGSQSGQKVRPRPLTEVFVAPFCFIWNLRIGVRIDDPHDRTISGPRC